VGCKPTRDGPLAGTKAQQASPDTLKALHAARDPVSPYVFPHRTDPHVGAPVMDIKNGFHAALELAKIDDFTWRASAEAHQPGQFSGNGSSALRGRPANLRVTRAAT
jgi:hypothetical protein